MRLFEQNNFASIDERPEGQCSHQKTYSWTHFIKNYFLIASGQYWYPAQDWTQKWKWQIVANTDLCLYNVPKLSFRGDAVSSSAAFLSINEPLCLGMTRNLFGLILYSRVWLVMIGSVHLYVKHCSKVYKCRLVSLCNRWKWFSLAVSKQSRREARHVSLKWLMRRRTNDGWRRYCSLYILQLIASSF